MRLISRTELKKKLDGQKDLRLLFTLGDWQFSASHIPGSRQLPCPPALYRSAEALEGISKDDEIVVYCSNEACSASVSAYCFFEKRGFTNVSRYAGGLLDWQSAGFALEGTQD